MSVIRRPGSFRRYLPLLALGLLPWLGACRSPGGARPGHEGAAAILQGRGEFWDGTLIADFVLSPIAGGGPGRPRPDGGGPGGEGLGGLPVGRPGEADGVGVAGVGLRATTVPRQSLRLVLRNQGKADLTVNVVMVQSELCVFAPKPERLLLAPGQEAPLAGMGFGLAFTPNALEVTLTLRSAGREETRVIRLSPTDHVRPLPEYPPVRGL